MSAAILQALTVLTWEDQGGDAQLKIDYESSTGNKMPGSFDENSQDGEHFRNWHRAQIRGALAGLRDLNSQMGYSEGRSVAEAPMVENDLSVSVGRANEIGLSECFDQIHATAISKGWWESSRDFAHVNMLVVDEIAEAVEEWRTHLLSDERFIYGNYAGDCFILFNQDNGGFDLVKISGEGQREMLTRNVNFPADLKPEGIATECADAIIRIADYCGYWKIPLAQAIVLKMEYNATRPHRHGRKA